MSKFNSLFVRILLAVIGICVLIGFVFYRLWWLLPIGILLCVCSFCLFRHSKNMLRERCWLMLEAMRNSDYSFRLPMKGLSGSEYVLQSTLNDFGKMMGEQKQWMEQKERYYELILESVTTGIVVLDTAGNVVQTNAAAAKLLCLPVLSTLEQLNRYGLSYAEKIRALRGGDSESIHFQTERGEMHLLLEAVEIELAGRRVRVITINDIRDEMSDKELDSWVRLTRVLTHEIMNSIAPISSLSEVFMNRPEIKNGDLFEGMRAIRDTSCGLMQFVDSYRKFSSLQKPQPSAFSFADMMRQVIGLGVVPDYISCAVRILPEDLLVYADPNLIRQVLINLLKNAVQAIQEACIEDGRIQVEALVDEQEHILVYFSNNGPVVDKQVADEIFIPFFTTRKDGNGIGLSLSRRIMTMSGGRISLLPSGTKGWNTTFLLEFE
ncbi:MAG: ATP-binding protein [Bacteroides sp.]|nr:ATP-binding protein [Roseburia sp.]MCM1345924.1 ATP-binding protein [Bacteroides sp.]MCM1420089.1 ATP-binding protein [Bacteroides sp.]